MGIQTIILSEHLKLIETEEGFTVWGSSWGVPTIITDAPYERLKQNPEYREDLVDSLQPYFTPENREALTDVTKRIEAVKGINDND